MTEQSDEEGRVVTLGLRLRDKTVEEAIIYDRRCLGNGDQGVYLQTLLRLRSTDQPVQNL